MKGSKPPAAPYLNLRDMNQNYEVVDLSDGRCYRGGRCLVPDRYYRRKGTTIGPREKGMSLEPRELQAKLGDHEEKHHWSEDSYHSFAPAVKGVLAQIKALGDTHGTWRYAEDDSDARTKAAGSAFDITAGVIEIAGLEGFKSEIRSIKAAVGKLFDNIELYEDGAQYFDESKADEVSGGRGALAALAMVLRGVSALASVPDGLKIKEEKVFGLGKAGRTGVLSIGCLEHTRGQWTPANFYPKHQMSC